MRCFKRIIQILVVGACFFGSCLTTFNYAKEDLTKPVRLGCFIGGKSNLFFRVYVNQGYENEKVNVNYYTQHMRDDHPDDFELVPKAFEDVWALKRKVQKNTYFGKVTGSMIIEGIKNGLFDGGTVGEAAFVKGVSEGVPVVAVALLGHDSKDLPAKAIFLRRDIKINGPNDFKGKTIISRRSSYIDDIFLREFIDSIGLKLSDMNIIEGVNEDDTGKFLKNKDIDGGLYHINKIEPLVEKGIGYVYRKMDWVNPELSHAVLVFHKDYFAKNRQKIKRIVMAYMKRIKFEDSIPWKEKVKEKRWGLQMVTQIPGMDWPVFDYPPLVRKDLLDEIQRLSSKYGYIDQSVDMAQYIDYSIVQEVFEEMK